jgi:hypothetical protein
LGWVSNTWPHPSHLLCIFYNKFQKTTRSSLPFWCLETFLSSYTQKICLILQVTVEKLPVFNCLTAAHLLLLALKMAHHVFGRLWKDFVRTWSSKHLIKLTYLIYMWFAFIKTLLHFWHWLIHWLIDWLIDCPYNIEVICTDGMFINRFQHVCV